MQFSVDPTACQRMVTERGRERRPSFQSRAGTLQEVIEALITTQTSLESYSCTSHVYVHQKKRDYTHLKGELSVAEQYD